MKYYLFIAFALLSLISCHPATTVKEAINKSGELAGKGASEFAHGVYEGVDQTFQCQLELSKALADKGIKTGKFKITGDTVLSAYIIFDDSFKGNIHVMVFDNKGQEYGRASLNVEGTKGDAKYFDFAFDGHTRIETKSKFVLQ